MKEIFHNKKLVTRGAIGAAVLCIGIAGYTLAYAQRMLPHVHIGSVAVGGMTPHDAQQALDRYLAVSEDVGLPVRVENDVETIHFQNLGFSVRSSESVQDAFSVGRRGEWYTRIGERLKALVWESTVPPQADLDTESLDHEIESLAELIDQPRKDIRLNIQGTRVGILTDTKPGKVIDRETAKTAIARALASLDFDEISIALKDDVPSVNPDTIAQAKVGAERMLASSLSLTYEGRNFFITREQIGSWILSGYHDDQLIPTSNERLISRYITTVAEQINITPEKATIKVEGGNVTQFIPPKPGRVLEENKTVRMIVDALNARRDAGPRTSTLALLVKKTSASAEGMESIAGITELIGKATTSLAGSPKNRISNILNGVKFLTGSIVQPGEEFSTIKTLGTIDNTTGYLPELVIKGSETVPEFGGGLCQVSTTLFRAFLNAGLPITARSNHAYRVSYYEKDGNGAFIGPGLDATIYDPEPDLKFKNDTQNPILIYGYVEGTKVTFELYGTSDGRTAQVKGPTILSEIPPGDPIYTETDTLAKGVTKQTETAHAGGSAIATYVVTYPDGVVQQVDFRSYYRRWPARYLVGTKEELLPSPTP